MSVPNVMTSEIDLTAAPRPVPRWGFWATCAWGIAILAATMAAQGVAVMVALIAWDQIDPANAPTNVRAAMSDATILTAMELVTLPITLLIVRLATRLARVRFADYLALKPIGARAFWLGLACTLGYLIAVDLFGYASGRGLSVPWVREVYSSALASGTLPALLIVIVVMAPITEEVLFRGFLFRGWAASRLGVAGAVVLSSAIWAALHVQYDWITMCQIFGLGLIFGWQRHRTGSTLTTIALHGIYSLGAMGQAAILAG